MPGETAKLAVRNVTKIFRIRGRRSSQDRILKVLGGVSFDVRQGEVVSIIGESGCGKTTLLRIIQGLIRFDSGSILVDGVPVTKPGRDRGFVFQHASLLPWRTARHNVSSLASNFRESQPQSGPAAHKACWN
jgi:NitT/TauT family transport system ATP-binding protein